MVGGEAQSYSELEGCSCSLQVQVDCLSQIRQLIPLRNISGIGPDVSVGLAWWPIELGNIHICEWYLSP
jgi:hypothetical protein